ncbi:MAG: thermonuclease family protein [Candidatus Aminicenantes bacterium]|nr:thermonuclease family protein [Candidatus Aminicenantes bacterium]
MKEVEDRSIHLIVTSPPYWQLKDYGEEKQIGFNDTYEAYINNLNLVWMECNRVLHHGCRLCVNIGDQFARSVYYGRYKIIPIRTEIIKFCETIGFDYMGAVIWQKVTTCNTTGGATIMGSFPYPRNGILKIDYEFILIFKKYGGAPSVSAADKEQSRLTTEEWNLYFNGHWNFPGEKQDKHLAMFPEELPRRLIRMFSFKGDTVLDPFLGSGTTSLAARNLGRNSIGYEINPAFLPIIKDKLRINQSKIFELADYEIIHQEDMPIEFDERIRSLPYTFRDPIKFDKKVDPKKLSFGSRIDDNPKEREDLFAVEKIISPEIMILDNGLKIKLLGIKAINDRIEKAIDYLRAKTKGQKIFLRFDSIKYDKENNLLCYVYLKNRLFLNAHLIKAGLAEVETSYDFKYKIKFENERRELSA